MIKIVVVSDHLQVSSVALCELPGCSLSTFGQCWSLRYLTVTHCQLVALEGLSQCKHLHYINAQVGFGDIYYSYMLWYCGIFLVIEISIGFLPSFFHLIDFYSRIHNRVRYITENVIFLLNISLLSIKHWDIIY